MDCCKLGLPAFCLCAQPTIPERRLLLCSAASLAGVLLGWQINARILRYIYHYIGQEGIKFAAFDYERLERLIFGWLESFGFQTGEYIRQYRTKTT